MNKRRFLASLLMLLLFFSAALTACRERPATDFIDDRSGLLAAPARARIVAMHRQLLSDLDLHLKVVILAAPVADLDAEALRLVEEGKVGRATKGARGVLLLIDPQGQQVRLEVGYDLESFFTDAFIARIERQQMLPFFQAGRVGDGVEATVELLVAQALQDGKIVAESAGTALPHLSGGGGAKSAVAIGSGSPAPAAAHDAQRFVAGATPLATLESYLEVLRARVDPQLPLYTTETRVFLARWLVTDAQQAQELRTLSAALAQAEVRSTDEFAVVRFPLTQRQAPPYLLRRDAVGWQLDVVAMSQLLGFNHRNEWHFRTLDHPWLFAFSDCSFDEHGFPHACH